MAKVNIKKKKWKAPIVAFLKRHYRLKTYTDAFKNVGIEQLGLLPWCIGDTTKHDFRKSEYSSNRLISAFLGARTAF